MQVFRDTNLLQKQIAELKENQEKLTLELQRIEERQK